MATKFYKKLIMEYFADLPGEPVTTDMVTAYIQEKTGEQKEKIKKIVNVNLARLKKEGIISRIVRGVYCKPIKTLFGDYVPDKDMIYDTWLVKDGDNIIGYETNLSLMNQVGLVSQVPRKKQIASNNYNLSIPKDIGIEVKKPQTAVTKDNYQYLQILDMINAIDNAAVDSNTPEEIIRQIAINAGLTVDRLILYARKFYPTKTLERTIDIFLGGMK